MSAIRLRMLPAEVLQKNIIDAQDAVGRIVQQLEKPRDIPGENRDTIVIIQGQRRLHIGRKHAVVVEQRRSRIISTINTVIAMWMVKNHAGIVISCGVMQWRRVSLILGIGLKYSEQMWKTEMKL